MLLCSFSETWLFPRLVTDVDLFEAGYDLSLIDRMSLCFFVVVMMLQARLTVS